MNLQNYSSQNKRLLGIDLFKGIAAYGVVLIHGLGELPRDENALLISKFFVAFCVPYFLATSFYFSSYLLLFKTNISYLKTRVKRILVPYLAWSLIYLLARLAGFLIGNKESFYRLISDPVNMIFFGASAVHLYFLPLLFCGTVVAIPIIRISRKIQNNLLILFFVLSIAIYYLVAASGNDFLLGEGIAFKQIIDISFLQISNYWMYQFIRIIFVILAWIIRCMPYIIFGIIIHKTEIQKLFYTLSLKIKKRTITKSLIIFLIPLLIFALFISKISFLGLFIPYLTLIYSILISNLISKYVTMTWLTMKLGYLSFGIYLYHALITAGFMPILIKLYPKIINLQLSPLILIISSLVIFFVSLAITYIISLNKTAARILLAI
ncbi:acyltransferase family protein [Chlorogloeopsis fritschii PCC 9212]|nr:acyltransferase [Chlorogloeopsis fritschii]MBF2005161.1 acyltransferase [Chlorogloeopsis fritschii C42_A2020_084]